MRKFLLFLVVIISSFSRASANLNPATFEFAAEWLYMLDSIDRPFYSFDSDDAVVRHNIGKEHAIEQTWHSGYRLEASRQFCGMPSEILVRWTHFPQFSNSASVDGIQIIEITDTTFSHSSIHTKINFYSLELLYNYYIFQNSCFSMELETGLEHAQIRFKEKIEGSGINTIFLKSRSERWGIGPEIGLEINYALWRGCLVLEARMEASLLATRRKMNQFQISGGVLVENLESERYWIVIPSFDLRLGLKFNRCINNCLALNIEAGYEFMTYTNGINRFSYISDTDFYMDFALHGPFVRFGVAF